MSRKDLPPERPPPPNSSLNKRSPSSGSIKFSFKSLEEDEENEEDLTLLTRDFNKKVSESKKSSEEIRTKSSSVTKTESKSLQKMQSGSRSFEEDKSTNISRWKQNFADISSIVRKKVSEKLEDISKEIAPVPENENANKSASVKPEVTTSTGVSALNKDYEVNVTNAGHLPEQFKEVSDREMSDENESSDFQIVDDFYTPVSEPHEDFTGTQSISPELRFRNKSLKQKLKRSKPNVTTAPVSLSNLKAQSDSNLSAIENSDMAAENNNEEDSQKELRETSGPETVTTARKDNSTSVPWQNLTIGAGGLFLYLIIPFPSYVSGMIMGMLLASCGWMVYLWLTKPPIPRTVYTPLPLDQLPPFIMPYMKDVKTEDGVFKGWMNEIAEYNPDNYHINNTHSIQILLEGTTLRLRRPKVNIAKRATFDEEKPNVKEFIHQRHFDIKDSRIFLLPPGLVKKRIWSKKYPICVALANYGKKSDRKKDSSSPDSDGGFEFVTEEKCDDGVLYLFARTCREKEDWFKRLQAAADGNPLKSPLGQIRKFYENRKKITSQGSTSSLSENVLAHKRQGSTDSTSSNNPSPVKENDTVLGSTQDMESFVKYMGKLMPAELYDRFSSSQSKDQQMIDCEDQLLWMNALISRCCWDFLKHPAWAEKVMDKLQKKLSKIHIPYFIEELKITHITLGSEMPVIRKASRPYFDDDGFWVDLAVNYGGGFQMTIETKVNLMKLKSSGSTEKTEDGEVKKSAITDEEEEDSAESSTDEEEESVADGTEDSGKGGKKFMKYVNKITQSKYFKSATELKYIKKAMEEVSNTPLILTVEARYLSGELAINIPFPPTDRFWYGFKGNPKLTLVAKPKVGAREVTVTHITDWIEKKLLTEFQRTFVLPNMDDLVVPLFTSYIPDGAEA